MKNISIFLLFLLIFSCQGASAEQTGDMNGDTRVGLEEAIISLQIASDSYAGNPLGTYVPSTGTALPSEVLSGKTFSNSGENNLVGTYTSPPARTIGCSTTNVWSLTNCVSDCTTAFSGTNDLVGCNQYCVAILDGIDDRLYGNRIPCIKLW